MTVARSLEITVAALQRIVDEESYDTDASWIARMALEAINERHAFSTQSLDNEAADQ